MNHAAISNSPSLSHGTHNFHNYTVKVDPNDACANRQGLILVHFSAQPEPSLTQNKP